MERQNILRAIGFAMILNFGAGTALAGAPAFKEEHKAAYKMFEEMHIGKGTITPLPEKHAVELYNKCFTRKLEMTRVRYAMGLATICSALKSMSLTSGRPSHKKRCENLGYAASHLYDKNPNYKDQQAGLVAMLRALEKAEFCIHGDVLIDVKSLPPRPASAKP